jgi:sugar O-acyltransferase (sialic acid O-acetyltransferase NeuD family)
MKKVLIVGSSGHTKVIIDIFEKGKEYQIIGLLDSFRSPGESTMGYTILGGSQDVLKILTANPGCFLFVAIGDNYIRKIEVEKIIRADSETPFANAIHPSTQIGRGVSVGRGVAILAGSIINSDSVIGDFALINTSSSIDHDNFFSPYSSTSPGVITGGNVVVGECSALLLGAMIKHKIIIGKHCVVGAGAVLLRDCPDYTMVYGNPAKPIRKRLEGEKYL